VEPLGPQRDMGQVRAPLVEGGTVDMRANHGTVYHCLIRRFEPGRALELVVKPALLTIINI
jgi:hypothetical protein